MCCAFRVEAICHFGSPRYVKCKCHSRRSYRGVEASDRLFKLLGIAVFDGPAVVFAGLMRIDILSLPSSPCSLCTALLSLGAMSSPECCGVRKNTQASLQKACLWGCYRQGLSRGSLPARDLGILGELRLVLGRWQYITCHQNLKGVILSEAGMLSITYFRFDYLGCHLL